jgi:hypothetical protein
MPFNGNRNCRVINSQKNHSETGGFCYNDIMEKFSQQEHSVAQKVKEHYFDEDRFKFLANGSTNYVFENKLGNTVIKICPVDAMSLDIGSMPLLTELAHMLDTQRKLHADLYNYFPREWVLNTKTYLLPVQDLSDFFDLSGVGEKKY